MASRNKSTEGMARTSTRSVWKGAITFGLVHIPIGLYSATAESDLNFDWLDKRTGDPVGYKRVNKKTGREIDAAHIAKGIEYQKGEYVILSKEEIAEAYPRTTQTIEIEAFVDIDEVPFVYLEKPYYTAPINRGEKVYALLRETLVQSKKAGIARVVIQTKQHLAILVPMGPALVLNLMHWGDEIRSWEDLPLPGDARPKDAELRMAKQLVAEMSGHWRADEYRDSFRDAIMKLVETKAQAGDTQDKVQLEEAPEERGGADVIDLTELLKRSLQGGKGAARKSPAKPAAKTAAKATAKKAAHKTSRKTAARKSTGARARKAA